MLKINKQNLKREREKWVEARTVTHDPVARAFGDVEIIGPSCQISHVE